MTRLRSIPASRTSSAARVATSAGDLAQTSSSAAGEGRASPAAGEIAVDCRKLVKRFAGGTVVALDGVSLTIRSNEFFTLLRAVRMRQDDLAASHRRLRDAGSGLDPRAWSKPRRASPVPPAGQHGFPELCGVPAYVGGGEHRVRLADAAPVPRPYRVPRQGDAGTGAPRGPGKAQARRSFPADSSSASRWRARWRRSPACFFSTSRSRRSIKSYGPECSSSSSGCRTKSASPSSSSRMISMRR